MVCPRPEGMDMGLLEGGRPHADDGDVDLGQGGLELKSLLECKVAVVVDHGAGQGAVH